MLRRLAPLSLLLLSTALGACAKKDKLDATVEASQVWQERCVTCHGSTGAGDGPAARGLKARPRSFQDPAWQASVTNERIKQVIVKGGSAVGLDGAMAPNPDLADKPEVQDELVKKIRALVK